MAVDFAIIGSLVRPGRPRYPVCVHRAAALLHAFFGPHLAVTPLRFASPSQSSGWTEDFHLQAVVHTRHTKTKTRALRPAFDLSAISLARAESSDVEVHPHGLWLGEIIDRGGAVFPAETRVALATPGQPPLRIA